MENYRGDLADIVRASGGAITGEPQAVIGDSWQFPADHPMNLYPCDDDFGDPFSNVRDPLLLGQVDISNSSYFMSNSSNSIEMMKTSVKDTGGTDHHNSLFVKKNSISVSVSSFSNSTVVGEETKKRPPAAACNIFSRMLQISPNTKTLPPPPPPIPPLSPTSDSIKPPPPPPLLLSSSNDIITANTSKACLLENTGGGVQISSPRNTGIKRRKSQAKKVVCIPAPAPANSRPTGEVVPSDLWAWRKYGQKPIKGSPYPRGYYRCSSSKGCSARKQVERSRTDPNMLVITYTSEHNHPWPTQRNALAGSTRAQPSMNNNNNNNSAGGSKNSPIITTTSTTSHEHQKKEAQRDNNISSSYNPSVKQEILEVDDQFDHHNQILEMDGGDHPHHHHHRHHPLFREGSYPHDHQSYRPTLPAEDTNLAIQSGDQDFFADLGEIEADPLNLLFTRGFSGGGRGDERESNKASLDPFTDLFDWTGSNNNK